MAPTGGGASITPMAEALPVHVQFRRDHQVELLFAIMLIVTIPIAIGLWRAQEWARVMFGIIAVVIASLGMILLVFQYSEMAPIGRTIGRFCMAIVWAYAAYHVLRPAAESSFAAARESLARARALPR